MNRQEIYQHIKSNHLEDTIKKVFERNYTNISTAELMEFINRREKRKKEKVLSGMTKEQSNAECNKKILSIIAGYLKDNPDVNFEYALHYLGLSQRTIYNSSQATLQRMNAIKNRSARN